MVALSYAGLVTSKWRHFTYDNRIRVLGQHTAGAVAILGIWTLSNGTAGWSVYGGSVAAFGSCG